MLIAGQPAPARRAPRLTGQRCRGAGAGGRLDVLVAVSSSPRNVTWRGKWAGNWARNVTPVAVSWDTVRLSA